MRYVYMISHNKIKRKEEIGAEGATEKRKTSK